MSSRNVSTRFIRLRGKPENSMRPGSCRTCRKLGVAAARTRVREPSVRSRQIGRGGGPRVRLVGDPDLPFPRPRQGQVQLEHDAPHPHFRRRDLDARRGLDRHVRGRERERVHQRLGDLVGVRGRVEIEDDRLLVHPHLEAQGGIGRRLLRVPGLPEGLAQHDEDEAHPARGPRRRGRIGRGRVQHLLALALRAGSSRWCRGGSPGGRTASRCGWSATSRRRCVR